MIRAPAELSHLASLMGDAALRRLIEKHGGTRLYVPQTPGAELVALIGDKAARLLCESHGGVQITVPLAKGWLIRLYRAEGATHREIALRLKVSEDTVCRALSRDRPARENAGPRDLLQLRMEV